VFNPAADAAHTPLLGTRACQLRESTRNLPLIRVERRTEHELVRGRTHDRARIRAYAPITSTDAHNVGNVDLRRIWAVSRDALALFVAKIGLQPDDIYCVMTQIVDHAADGLSPSDAALDGRRPRSLRGLLPSPSPHRSSPALRAGKNIPVQCL
jgi:hypothetical protein